MNTMPWDYWSADGQPKPATVEVIASLERIIARSPRHPLALHLYIHAVEASSTPGRAEKAADTLLSLVPGSGHLVHMPAHTYWRVGRYHDASEANVKAAQPSTRPTSRSATPRASTRRCTTRTTSTSSGRRRAWRAAASVAIEAARKVAANVRLEQIKEFPSGRVLQDDSAAGTRAVRAMGRGARRADAGRRARLRHGDSALRARHRVRAGRAISRSRAASPPALAAAEGNAEGHGHQRQRLPGEGAARDRRHAASGRNRLGRRFARAAPIRHFRRAVTLQDALPYTEPPFWYYPTRQSLGMALLAAKRAAEAEAVYRKDLEAVSAQRLVDVRPGSEPRRAGQEDRSGRSTQDARARLGPGGCEADRIQDVSAGHREYAHPVVHTPNGNDHGKDLRRERSRLHPQACTERQGAAAQAPESADRHRA